MDRSKRQGKSYKGRTVSTNLLVVLSRSDDFIKIKSIDNAKRMVGRVASTESARIFKLHRLVATEALHVQTGMTRKMVTTNCEDPPPLLNVGKFTTLPTIQFAPIGGMVIFYVDAETALAGLLEGARVVENSLKVTVLLSQPVTLADGRVVQRPEVDVETLAGQPFFEALEDPLDAAGRPIERSAFVQAYTREGFKVVATHEQFDPLSKTSFLKLSPRPLRAPQCVAVDTATVVILEGADRRQKETEQVFMKELEMKIREAQTLLNRSIVRRDDFDKVYKHATQMQKDDWFLSRVDLTMDHTGHFDGFVKTISPNYATRFEGESDVEGFVGKNLLNLDPDFANSMSSGVLANIMDTYSKLAQKRFDDQKLKVLETGCKDDKDSLKCWQRHRDLFIMEQEMKNILELLKIYKQKFIHKENELEMNSMEQGQIVSLQAEELAKLQTVRQPNGDLLLGSAETPALLKPPVVCTVVVDTKLQKKLTNAKVAPGYKLFEQDGDELRILRQCMPLLCQLGDESRRWLFTTPQIREPYQLSAQIPQEFRRGQTVIVGQFSQHRWFVLDVQPDQTGQVFARLQHKFYDMDLVVHVSKLKPNNKGTLEMRANDVNEMELQPRDLVTQQCLSSMRQRDVYVLCCDYGYCVTADIWNADKVVYSTVKGSLLTMKERDALRNVHFDCGVIPVDGSRDMEDVL